MNPEVWGPAYLGCLFALLLFSFGFPALLVQIVAPKEDVRSIVMPRLFRVTILLGLFLTLAAGSLIWHLGGRGGLREGAVMAYGSILVFVATGITAVACSSYMSALSREAIVKQVVERFEGQRRGSTVAVEEAAAALAALGSGSSAGTEKGYVLGAIGVLLAQTIGDASYDGTRCAAPLEAVKRTLLMPGSTSNPEDFKRGGEALASARRQILEVKNGALKNSADLKWTTDALAEVVLAAAMAGHMVGQDLLELLPPEKLLEVGAAAWCAGRVPTVTYAVMRLRSAYDRALEGKQPDTVAAGNALALHVTLLAYLASGGAAARQWSAERLVALRRDLVMTELEQVLDRAWEDRYKVGDWASADAVNALREALKGTPPAVTG